MPRSLRLNSYNGDQNTVSGGTLASGQQIQAGDEVIIFARGGLDFGGKYNINEEHTVTADYAPGTPGSRSTFFTSAITECRRPSMSIWTITACPTFTACGVLDEFGPLRFDACHRSRAFPRRLGHSRRRQTRQSHDPNWVSNGTVTVENARGHKFSMQLGTATFRARSDGLFQRHGHLRPGIRRRIADRRLRGLGDGPSQYRCRHRNRRRWSWQRSRWAASSAGSCVRRACRAVMKSARGFTLVELLVVDRDHRCSTAHCCCRPCNRSARQAGEHLREQSQADRAGGAELPQFVQNVSIGQRHPDPRHLPRSGLAGYRLSVARRPELVDLAVAVCRSTNGLRQLRLQGVQ